MASDEPSTSASTSTSTSSYETASERAASPEDTAEPVPPADGEPAEGSEEHVKKCLHDAAALKLEGTAHFGAAQWAQALATYSAALGRLPRRREDPRAFERAPDAEAAPTEEEKGDEDGDRAAEKAAEPASSASPPLSGLELECAKARSVLNANIGACHVKLEEYKEAVKACTEALADDPSYVRALQRRAQSNEKIGSWSALSSAQEDYSTLLKILPVDSPQIGPTKRALSALGPRAEEAQKKETSEVLGKLKGLGNSLLGNFGLSTDNFKFEPNGQGGYSVNFAR